MTQRLCLTSLALVCAATTSFAGGLTLTMPLDYQVVQRASRTGGQLPVSGRLMPGTRPTSLEARTTGPGGNGRWQPLAFKAGADAFSAGLSTPAGGWYRLEVRALAAGKVLAETNVAHVGIGEVFVIAGQSNSANHGEEKQQTKTSLVAAFDGKTWQLADDPQPGASGNRGSFLPPFGDALAARLKVPIGIVAAGVGATSVREWLPAGTRFPNPPTLLGNVTQLPSGGWECKGRIYSNFVARARSLGPRGFRTVLWHQGESDANQKDTTRTLPGALYERFLSQLIRDSRRDIGWDAPWFIAQVSYHVPGDEASPDIRAAQAALWKGGLALEGPDSDALKGQLRERGGLGVHFSGPGLRAHAARWVEKVAPWLEKQLASSPPR